MTDQLEADTQAEHEQLVERALALGLTQAKRMKPETLVKRLAEAEKQNKQVDGLGIEIDEEARKALVERGFNFKHLKRRAEEYRIDQLIYDKKRRAFGCFRAGQLIDFLDAGAF